MESSAYVDAYLQMRAPVEKSSKQGYKVQGYTVGLMVKVLDSSQIILG